MDWTAVDAAMAIGLAGVVASFLVGLRAVVVALTARLVARVAGKGLAQRVRQFYRLLDVLSEARAVPGVTHAAVFSGHGGGAMPAAGRPYFVRRLMALPAGASRYDFDAPVDAAHVAKLEALVSGGESFTEAASLPQGRLRAYLEAEGIRNSAAFHLGEFDGTLLYASFGGDSPFPPGTLDRLRLACDEMRAVLAD